MAYKPFISFIFDPDNTNRTDMQPIMCPNCEIEAQTKEITIVDGSKRLQRFCPNCDRKLGFAPMNKDPSDFVMPFGKHAQKTLKEILKVDRPYLVWCSTNLDSGTVRTRINQILESSIPG